MQVLKNKYVLAVLMLALSFYLGYSSKKPDIKIKEKKIYVKQIQERIKIVEKPNGDKVTEIDRTTKEDGENESSNEVSYSKPDWLISGGMSIEEEWKLGASRRILGNIYAGAEYGSNGQLFGTIQVLF